MDEAALAVLKAELDDASAELERLYVRIGERQAGFRRTEEGVQGMAIGQQGENHDDPRGPSR